MPDYLVTITRTLTIYGAGSSSAAAARALDHEASPGPTENRFNSLVLRVDVERWDRDDTTEALAALRAKLAGDPDA